VHRLGPQVEEPGLDQPEGQVPETWEESVEKRELEPELELEVQQEVQLVQRILEEQGLDQKGLVALQKPGRPAQEE
jgi:hypothetical protein